MYVRSSSKRLRTAMMQAKKNNLSASQKRLECIEQVITNARINDSRISWSQLIDTWTESQLAGNKMLRGGRTSRSGGANVLRRLIDYLQILRRCLPEH